MGLHVETSKLSMEHMPTASDGAVLTLAESIKNYTLQN